MRQILFDTEITGLSSKEHRLVSIAGVELKDGELTGDFFHFYLNPERPCDPGAAAIHGLTDEFLATQPKFAEVWPAIKRFLGDSPLIIHNAQFDVGFLGAEVARLVRTALPVNSSVCTLSKARALRGRGGKGHNTLDTLASVYRINNLRQLTGKHGALVDCLTLYGVYRALFGLERRPMVLSEIEHYLDVIPGIYYVRPEDFAKLREGRESVSAREEVAGVPADVRPGRGGTGQDVLRDDQVPHPAGAGVAVPAGATGGSHSGSGGAGLVVDDPLLAAVRRGGI